MHWAPGPTALFNIHLLLLLLCSSRWPRLRTDEQNRINCTRPHCHGVWDPGSCPVCALLRDGRTVHRLKEEGRREAAGDETPLLRADGTRRASLSVHRILLPQAFPRTLPFGSSEPLDSEHSLGLPCWGAASSWGPPKKNSARTILTFGHFPSSFLASAKNPMSGGPSFST